MIANVPVKLSTSGAAEYVGVAVQTLRSWRCSGKGPRYIKAGGKVIYTQRNLDEWLESRTVNSTSALDS